MKVKIKTWDAMQEEYGLSGDGTIDVLFAFTQSMEQDMPEDRVIEVQEVSNIAPYKGYKWKVPLTHDDKKWREWDISSNMVEEEL